MGIQIITGGGAAQFGSGMGKGIGPGLDAGLEAKQKQQYADDVIKVLDMATLPMIEEMDRKTPDVLPGNPTMIGTGPFQVPAYLKPVPNPEQAQVDKIAEMYARGVHSVQDPELKGQVAQAAAAQLDQLQAARVERRLMSGMKAAQKSGLLDDSDLQMLAGLVEGGADPTQVYRAFDEVRQERIQEQTNMKRAARYLESNQMQVAAMRQTADSIMDPEEKAWAAQQAGRLASKLDEIEVSLMAGMDDFDFEDAVRQVDEIKFALNPYQRARMDEREARTRSFYEARERVLTDQEISDEDKGAMLRQIDQHYGMGSAAPDQRPVGWSLQNPAQTQQVQQPQQVEAAPERVEPTPEQAAQAQGMAAARKAEGALAGADPFADAGTVEDVERVAQEKVVGMLDSLLLGDDGASYEVKPKKGQSMTDAYTERLLAEIKKLPEQQAARIMEQVRALAAARREARARVEAAPEKKAKAKKKRDDMNDAMGGAAWGGM